MIKIRHLFAGLGLLALSPIVVMADAAQQAAEATADFVETLNDVIIFPTIALLTAVALLVFFWGLFEYFMGASNDQARQQGVKHITWGIIGLVIMVSAYSILMIATKTFDLDKQLECADNPSASGCGSAFSLPSGPSGGAGTPPGDGDAGTPPGDGGAGTPPGN